jgi:4-amino-4-deoxy-L-arabinose transferase
MGSLIVLTCFLGAWRSWRAHVKGNQKLALLLLVVCGVALRVYVASDLYLHAWDERYHALVAKNLMQHPLVPTLYDQTILPYDHTNWTANHVWLHKQPFPLWTMAFSLWLFGVNEIALRLPSVLLSSLGIWLVYSIGRSLFNLRVGYLSAFFFSINGLIIELTGGRVATDHIDIFFLVLIELAIWFSLLFAKRRKVLYNLLAGAFIGAAILTKWLPALIVLPLWLLVVVQTDRFTKRQILAQFLLLSTTCICVFLPWQLYIYSTFPTEAAWEASFNVKHYTEALDGQGGSMLYFLEQIRINYGELVYLPLGWFTWRTLKSRNYAHWAVLLWFWVPFVFFSFAKTKMQGYILFTCPALFMMTADFFCMLQDRMKQSLTKWPYLAGMLLLITLPARYMVERLKPFSVAERNPQWVIDLRRLKNTGIQDGVLFNYGRPIEAMFYTPLTAYAELPARGELEKLITAGHRVFVEDDGTLPADVRSMPGVTLLSLRPPPP